jgi:hypothetical protein
MTNPKSNISDAELEEYISIACALIKTAPDCTAQRTAAQAMSRLIAMRSPERIKQMEQAKFGRSF